MIDGLLQDKGEGLLLEGARIMVDLHHEQGLDASLAVKAGRIVGIGAKDSLRQQFPKAERLDLTDFTIMPGLINAHTHVTMSFFRGLGQAQDAKDKTADSSMIENFFFPAEKALTPELIEALSYPYLVDALRSGSTTCVDAYFFMDGVAKAMDRLGVRGFIGEHIADLGGPHPAGGEVWKKTRAWIDGWAYSSRVQPVVYAHAADTVSFDLLKELGSFARSRNLPFHMHLSQTHGERERVLRRERKSPVRYAHDAGVLQERSLLVHLVSADRQDLQLIKQSGALACLCPVSEIIYEELPDLSLFFEEELRLALGTDAAASHDTADLLFEAKAMALFARQKKFQLSASQLGSMVLHEAAKTLAPNDLGGLAVGKLADLVCIRNGLESEPQSRPLTNIFFSAAHRQVEHVMVDGHWVLWRRDLVRVSESDLKERFSLAFSELKKRVNLPIFQSEKSLTTF